MFWKNTAWSWDNAADNDDAGYLLPIEEPRRTPDSTSDVDLNRITTTTGLKSSTNHKAWTNHNPTNLSYTRESNSTQQLMVSDFDQWFVTCWFHMYFGDLVVLTCDLVTFWSSFVVWHMVALIYNFLPYCFYTSCCCLATLCYCSSCCAFWSISTKTSS